MRLEGPGQLPVAAGQRRNEHRRRLVLCRPQARGRRDQGPRRVLEGREGHGLKRPASTLSRLSLRALDNHVDKFWQVLYDNAKCLILKGMHCVASFLGSSQNRGACYPNLRWTTMWITLDKPCMTGLSD